MPTGSDLLVELLRKQPMTSSQLQKEKVTKQTITRALYSGKIIADVAVLERHGRTTRFVALYCLKNQARFKQLDEMRQRDLFMPRSIIRGIEKSRIQEYLTQHETEPSIWLENMQNEIGYSLTDTSPVANKRRDMIFDLAKQKGLVVREGYSETITVGSEAWWKQHRDSVIKEIESFLVQPISEFHVPSQQDLPMFYAGWRDGRIGFGCNIGGVYFPNYETKLCDAVIRRRLRTTLQHVESSVGADLENLLEESVVNCQRALAITSNILKAIAATMKDFAAEIGLSFESEKFAHGVYFIYHLLCRRAVDPNFNGLKLVGPSTIGYEYPDKEIVETIFATLPTKIDTSIPMKWLDILNEFLSDESLLGQIRESMEEAKLSDVKLERFVSSLRGMEKNWQSKLTGKCDICMKLSQDMRF